VSEGKRDVRIAGRREAPEGHVLRDFLSRIDQDHTWVDPPGGAAHPAEPTVVVDGATTLVGPTLEELADALGIRYPPSRSEYDLVVIGAGPAGLAAAVYAASDGLRVAVAERAAPGGQAAYTSRIENYFGLDPDAAPMSGARLSRIGGRQAERFGAELLILRGVVGGGVSTTGMQRIELAGGEELVAPAVIVATGVEWRRLELEGLEELVGNGVYYGAGRSEAPRLRDAQVVIIGAGNSAAQAAMNFADYAEKVTMVVRGSALSASASRYLVDRIDAHPRIDVRLRSHVVELHADDRLREVTVGDADGDRARMAADGLFVAVGGVPQTQWAEDGGPRRDPAGYLLTGPDLLDGGDLPADWPLERAPMSLETTIPGFFAAGDVRSGSTKRVASAVGEGSQAVAQVHRHLEYLRT
jgi:thioredoxin reductase (NADPH)